MYDNDWPPEWLERAPFCTVCGTEIRLRKLLPDDRRESSYVCSRDCAQAAGVKDPPKRLSFPCRIRYGYRKEVTRDLD